MNFESAQLAKRCCLLAKSSFGHEALVAGSIGPTHRSVSIPYFARTSAEELLQSYFTQARGLLAGECDLILVESVMDWTNARAAIQA
ncbi:hypothetical protein GGI12_005504, partial [Dipsacomyces acuminosporus]